MKKLKNMELKMIKKINYILENWKMIVHLLFKTQRFGVNNLLWSSHPSVFGTALPLGIGRAFKKLPDDENQGLFRIHPPERRHRDFSIPCTKARLQAHIPAGKKRTTQKITGGRPWAHLLYRGDINQTLSGVKQDMSEDTKKVIYSMIRVSKFYDKKPVLKDISLSYFYGAKIGVLGLNGSGKSSLLKILAGLDKEFNGETILSKGFTVGYLEQEPLVESDKTVREIVEQGVQETVDLVNEYEAINEKFAEPMSEDEMDKLIQRQGDLQEQLDHLDAWDLDSRLQMAMDALGCPDGDTKVSIISGGEKRRVALCRLLLKQPDILLLDEPTNHLDAASVAWLEQHLSRYPGTVIAVTHDRYFLDNVAGWILELDRGEGIPWKGNYSSWLEQKQNRLKTQEKQESKRQKTLERELEWIKMSPKGRRSKSKARISAYDTLLNQDSGEKEKKSRDLYSTRTQAR